MTSVLKYILTFFLTITLAAASAQDIKKWKICQFVAYISKAEKPVIVNFFATFCKPCIKEIPYFQELARKYDSAGVQLLLVSIDMEETYPARLKAFAVKNKFTAPIVFLDETNADLFLPKIDEKWSGAIPASLFINNKTGYRKFTEGEIEKADLEKEIQTLIQSK